MQRYRLADLSKLPDLVLMGDGDFRIERAEWVQPADRWTAIYYHHSNVVGIGASTFKVDPDSIVVFAPGIRATHALIEDGTFHNFVSFNLPGDAGAREAIPLVNPDMAGLFPSLQRATQRIPDDRRPGLAWVYNFMWSIARTRAVVREHAELYAAEDWIYKHLSEHFTVPELAERVGTSARKLLKAFQEEHGTTVQGFIKGKRIQEATRLLATTERPIKEIAARVGVPDLQAFNKMIREQTGSSPSAFREVGRRKTAT